MKIGKFIFLLLFLNLIFAQSPNSKNSCLFNSLFVSISIAISIITILFFVGIFFNFQQLKFMAIKEIESLAFLVLILVIILFSFDYISKKLSWIIVVDSNGWDERFKSNTVIKSLNVKRENITIQQKAFVLMEENNELLKRLIQKLDFFAEAVAIESSKSYYFNFYSTGFGIGVCSTFSAFRGPLNLLYNAASLSSFGIYFTKFFLNVFSNQIICILFPIGLFLAFFNLTRKAGILLISICISFYFVFPTALSFLLDYYNFYYNSKGNSFNSQKNDLENSIPPTFNSIPPTFNCNPKEYASLEIPDKANELLNHLNTNVDKILNFVIVKSIFIPLLSISLTLSFASALAHALGLEIDLSILARLS